VAWKARKAFTDYDPQYRRISLPRQALGFVASPHAYEFARLRFLMEAWGAPFPQLEKLGQRLVHRNPQDYDVKYYLVQVLCTVPTPEAKQQALGYVREFMRANPKKISYWLNLGAVYNFSWYQSRGKNRADGKNAIAAYRKYLQLAPADDKKRKGVNEEIAYIQKRQAMWDKNASH
jgi:hypothetical protein